LPADEAKKPPDIRIRDRDRQPRDPQPEAGQAGLVDVQQADQAEDHEDAGVGVTGPRERLLESGHRDLTADDLGHEVAAELDRHDGEQDGTGDDAGCVGHA
jgi:hypothetical protein